MSNIRVRAWQEETLHQRVLNTGVGLAVVNRGDVAIVIVAKSWTDALRKLAELDPDLVSTEIVPEPT